MTCAAGVDGTSAVATREQVRAGYVILSGAKDLRMRILRPFALLRMTCVAGVDSASAVATREQVRAGYVILSGAKDLRMTCAAGVDDASAVATREQVRAACVILSGAKDLRMTCVAGVDPNGINFRAVALRLFRVNQPPTLISQQSNASIPSGDTLADAVLWDYGFTFWYRGDVAFDVTYNEERTVAYTIALEDADGVAQVRVTAANGVLPRVLYPDTTLVPAGDTYRYLCDDGTMLTFEDAAERPQRSVLIERLDALDVQSARVMMQEVAFPNPMVPFIENGQPIEIGGSRDSLASHISSLFHTLLANSAFAIQPLSLECRYAYVIGGVPVEAPVLLMPRSDFAIGFDEQVVEQIASGLTQWLDAVQPPAAGARFVFALTFWTAIPRTDARLLRLTNVSLPLSDVAL